MLKAIARRASAGVAPVVEHLLRTVERPMMSRGAVLDHIPPAGARGGGLGTTTYAEWCYTVGLFQTLIFEHLPARPVRMLDVGCGVGRLYLAAKSYLVDDDSYLGLDITKSSIAICRERYRAPNVDFLHVPAHNGFYATGSDATREPWPLPDESHNLVTALSVWTHLREEDWRFYLNEVARVLAPGGRAIITFFVMDELYRPERKRSSTSAYYPQPEDRWIFDTPAYDSAEWKTPSWVSAPEVAVAVPRDVLDREVVSAGLRCVRYLPGQWKDQPGFFFQDVAVLEKA